MEWLKMIRLNKLIPIITLSLSLATSLQASTWELSSDNTIVGLLMRGNTSQTSIAYQYSQSQNRVNYKWSDILSFSTWVDLESYWANQSLTNSYIESINQRSSNLPISVYKQLYSRDNYRLSITLKRAYMRIKFFKGDMVYGLQHYPLGVGKIWRPTDIMNQYNPLNQLASDRVGLVGVLYTYERSALSQWKIMVAHSHDSVTHKGARLGFNINGIDVSGVIINTEQNEIIGFDMIGSLGKTGVNIYSEIALNQDHNHGDRTVQAIIGFDTFLNSMMSMGIEGFYNENTSTGDNTNYQQWNYPGKYYLGHIMQIQVSPLINYGSSTMINLSDKSVIILPKISVSIRNNIDGLMGGSMVVGKENSEFKSYPQQVFIGISYYY